MAQVNSLICTGAARFLQDVNGNLIGNVTGNVTGNLTGNVTGNCSGTASNVTGTVAIANGGTGATSRLNALKALTNEDVGTNATYFLTITSSWGKGGYTSVANAKTVLGLGSAAYKDVPTSGNASTTQVVMGNDTRLSDSRPASDVSSWAKASTKPTYTASEVGALASTTKYAGASTAGGAATSANKLNTDAGSVMQSVYFSSGVPVATSIPATLYGTCTTAAGTVAKAVTCTAFTTTMANCPVGTTIRVKFTNGNTSTSPTLNVNSKGAVAILKHSGDAPGPTKSSSWRDSSIVDFTYDGTNWIMNDVNDFATATSITVVEDTSATNYYVTFGGTGDIPVEGGSYAPKCDDGFVYRVKTGTATSDGYSYLYLGNSTDSGTAGNKFGGVVLSSKKGTYRTILAPIEDASSATGNATVRFPFASGTVMLGSGTSGCIAKFDGTNSVTDGPAFGTGTTFLRNDGTWKTPTNTRNTAGATDTSSKIFLVGTTAQDTYATSYTQDTAYVGTDGCLYSNSTKVSVEGHTHSYLPLSGGTVTGSVRCYENGKGFVVGDGSVTSEFIGYNNNRGIYDITNSKWVVYSDNSGEIHIGGASVGGNTRPIYLNGGVPTKCGMGVVYATIASGSSSVYYLSRGLVCMFRKSTQSTPTVVLVDEWGGVTSLHNYASWKVEVYTSGSSVQLTNSGPAYVEILLIGEFSQ